MSVKVTEEAIQILGDYCYTREYHVERMHRDAKIQQLVIARAISGLRVE
jgi:alkylation response protein AidB-like acyl-CoA dehydrogenase